MINAYDFDGTIYDGDSSVDFYLYCLKRKKRVLKKLPIQMWAALLYVLKRIDKSAFKEKVFSFLQEIEDVDTYIKDFWKEHEKKMKDWYQKQKKETDVIISASPEFLLKPLEKKYHFTVIATKVNKKTGLFESKNCHDVEKIRRYEEQFHKKIKEFYTDSIKADKPMLEYAKVGYVVTKDKIEKYEGE